MIDLNAGAIAAMSGNSTQPIRLIMLGFDAPIYASDGVALAFDGHAWLASDIEAVGLTDKDGKIRLPNHDLSASALVLGQGVSGRAVEVWELYGTAPFSADSGRLLFAGVMDSVPVIGDFVEITVKSSGDGTSRAPRLPLSLWFGSDGLLAPGTTVAWDGHSITLGAQRG